MAASHVIQPHILLEYCLTAATPETSAIRSRLDTLTLLHLVEDATKALTEKGIDVVGHIKQMTAAATAGSATAAPPQPAQLQPQTRSTAELDKALEMLLTATDIVPTKAWYVRRCLLLLLHLASCCVSCHAS